MKSPIQLALGKDGIIRKVVDKKLDTGNRFSILSECMALSTPTSKRKDRTVMASWKNPIINVRQYANYGFNKENIKPKKVVTASELNPVNKTIKRDSGSESKAQSTTCVEEAPVCNLFEWHDRRRIINFLQTRESL